jgi:hypothetical protein
MVIVLLKYKTKGAVAAGVLKLFEEDFQKPIGFSTK